MDTLRNLEQAKRNLAQAEKEYKAVMNSETSDAAYRRVKAAQEAFWKAERLYWTE